MTNQNQSECCPRFDPTSWDGKTFEWNNKQFIKDHVFTFMYMPLNFGAVMKRMMNKVIKAGAKTPDNVCLSDHTSKWNMDVYLAVDKEIENVNSIALSGKYFSKVYEGPFQDTGKWMKDAAADARAKGHEVKKWYIWYTTCPKCAKKYGKNYVVIIGKINS